MKTDVQRAFTLIELLVVIAIIAILVALLLSRLFYAQVEPLIERIFTSMAKANETYSDTRMFYSYQFRNLLFFGLFTLAAGIVMRVSRCPIYVRNPLPSPPLPHGEGLYSAVVVFSPSP